MSKTTDAAAVIRAELRALGITSRKVSVRTDSFSPGSSIDVRIKDAGVRLSVVLEIAQHHVEETRHRFLSVEYSGEVLRGASRGLEQILATLASVGPGAAAHLAGATITRTQEGDFDVEYLDYARTVTYAGFYPEGAARLIASRLLSGGWPVPAEDVLLAPQLGTEAAA